MNKAAKKPKPKLILISGTAARLKDFERSGFLNRQKRLIKEYVNHFNVEYFTSDIVDYSNEIGVKHRPIPFNIDVYGFRHLLFWLYLVWKAPSMKAPIREFGVANPVLPFVKVLTGQKLIIGFQWDYASQTKASYRGPKRWLANMLQSAGLVSADFVICTTGRLKEIVERKYKKPAEVIPNFVDTELFRKGHEKEEFVLYAGRLHWAKGIEYLIWAFGLLKKKVPGARLVICGSGDYGRVLRRLAEKEGLTDVDFPGVVSQDRLARLMARARVFVLPTVNYEGHPKALIEAMACGTACVATDVPGCRDVIQNGENGLLVEPMNSIDLYEALLRLYEDREFTSVLERNAHAFAVDHYSTEKTVLKEVQLIQGLVGPAASADR